LSDIDALRNVSFEEINEVLEAFVAETGQASSLGLDSDEYIRSVLTKALGDDKATSLLNRILGGRDASGIESLKWMDAQSVAELIRNEHPQIIATILVHLERDHACGIINNFTERLRNDVILRIATLDGVQPAALRELNDVLTKLLTGNESLKKQQMGGIRTAAEILNFMSGENETAVMNNLRSYDEDMAQKIMDEMFVFENIIDIDGRGIQLLLREVQSESLIVALKGASQGLRDKDVLVRLYTAKLVGKVEPNNTAVVSVLIEAFQEKDAAARRLAAEILGDIRPNDDAVVDVLRDASRDADAAVRGAAEKALTKLKK